MGQKQKARLSLFIASLNLLVMAFLLFFGNPSAQAATGINSQLSFEGKIVNSNGTNLANNTYNMQFKIYQDGNNMGSGSTLKWTENRLVGGSGGVTLVDGTFHVNLGSVTAFGSSVDWNQDTLWLSMQIGNTSSCTITTSFQTDCSGDGEMTPFIRLTAVPYANNSAMLSGLVAGNFVQLAQGVQADSSTTNASIAINKTGSTANILTLQKAGSNVLVVNNNGYLALTPTAVTTSNVDAIAQTIANNSSSGSALNGLKQTITINSDTASTNNKGQSISITDNSAFVPGVSNINTGIAINLSGTNTDQTQYGADITVSNGFGIRVKSTGASTGGGTLACGNNNFTGNIAVCADATSGVGVYARGATGNGGLSTQSGSAIIGVNTNTGSGSSFYAGVKGIGAQSTNSATYTSVGVYGEGKTGTGSTAYGGYFTLNTGHTGGGTGLYASNSSIAANIIQLQDNTTDVMKVADGGIVTLTPNQSGVSLTVQGTDSNASLGSELVTSQAFNNATYWTCTGWTTSATTAAHNTGNTTACTATSSNFTVTSGATYLITYQLAGNSSEINKVGLSMGGSSIATDIGQTGTNTQQSVITTSSTAALSFAPYTNFDGTISAVSVKLITLSKTVIAINNSNASAGLEIRSGGGVNNMLIGIDSGRALTSGYNNTGIGTSSLRDVTTGDNNTGVGLLSLTSNTSGFQNTSTGSNALQFNTTGNYNTANGYAALRSNSTGSNNTSVGTRSLFGNSAGSNNTSNGYYSLYQNTSGTGNTSSGANSLYANNTGSFNTALGAEAGYQDPNKTAFATLSNLQNATAIGYGAQAQASNVLILGGVGTIASNLTPNVGIGTTSPSSLFSISPNYYDTGTASTTASTTVVGVGTTWTSSMVGMEFIFANGNKYTINGFTSATQMTLSSSSTNSSQAYRIHNPAFSVNTNGIVGLNPIGLTAGQSNILQTASNVSSTGGIVNGYSQTITVSNTATASTTNGLNISLTDNTALANINNGIKISLSGSNTSQKQIGIDSSVNAGFGVRGISTAAASGGHTCGSNLIGLPVGVCGNATNASASSIGVYGVTSDVGATVIDGSQAGVSGLNESTGAVSKFYIGAKGKSVQSASASYTSVGLYGEGQAGAGATVYGGYFKYGGGGATLGTSLYATNSSSAVKILQLQDNTSDVLLVADGGATTLSPVGDVTALTVKQTSDTTTPLRNILDVQNSAGTASFLALNVVSGTPHLRVYGSDGVKHADIYYDNGTSTAYFGASTGTAVLGSGTGSVNVTAGAGAGFVITGNAASSITTTAGDITLQPAGNLVTTLSNVGSLSVATKSATISGTYSSNDFTFTHNLTQASNLANGAVVKIEDVSTANSSAFVNTDLLLINQATAGSGGNLLRLQAAGSDKFKINVDGNITVGGVAIDSTGNLTIASGTSSVLTLTGRAASTWSTTAGLLTLQGGGGISLLSATNTTVTVDSGTTGTISIGAGNSTNAKPILIGNNNASSTVVIDAGTGAAGIEIGNTPTAHGIQIGTGAAVQTIIIGSTNTTSKLTLQGGVLTTTNNNSGIIIGGGYSSSDTSLVALTLDSFATFADTASSCTASVNGGSIYYNSNSNAVRGCVNGAWEDMVSSASLGLQLFGVIPDTGATPGDWVGITGTNPSTGPCKVYMGSTTATVRWTGCTVFSGGRKVIIPAQTSNQSPTLTNGNTVHICLTAAGNQPALSASGAATANLPAFSATAPILCLADLTTSAAAITRIDDTRTFTTTTKEVVNNITTAPALGMIAQQTTTQGSVTRPAATAALTALRGVFVATAGDTTANTMNAIIATAGPAYVRATAGTTQGFVQTGATTAGSAVTAAGVTTSYSTLGIALSTYSTACAANADSCRTSLAVNLAIK